MLGVEQHESGGASGGSSEAGGGAGLDELGERSGSGGGNRWPRQETLALLRIRSDMDAAFRDSNLKGPLWEEVSRKMAKLGFERSGKKCKEKFENVYKYHKRTKDGRATKADGKSYRFFEQLEALESTSPLSFAPPPPRLSPPTTMAPPPPPTTTNTPIPSSYFTITSSGPSPSNVTTSAQAVNNNIPITSFPSFKPPPIIPQSHQTQTIFHPSHNIHHMTTSLLSNSTSSSTSSDEGIQRRQAKKRKWKDFFEKLMNDVVHKQEELQKKFLDTLEKRERDRIAKEETWRVQEMAKMNHEYELIMKERSMAAAKGSAVIAFIQKVSEQHNSDKPIIRTNNAAPLPQVSMQAKPPPQNPQQLQPPAQMSMQAQPPPQNARQPQLPPPSPQSTTSPLPAATTPSPVAMATTTKTLPVSTIENCTSPVASSSRWPKTEVEALINIRTSLDSKYQDSGPKGPLWVEISSAMAKLGYNRSSKRCKEKWENINKYFKKVKESNKKRPEDAKTCPYFHQLDAIYKERANNEVVPLYNPSAGQPDNQLPIMARPEQQWPLPQQQQVDSAIRVHDQESDNNIDQEDQEYDEDDDDEEQYEEAGRYEIVTNKQPSSVTNALE